MASKQSGSKEPKKPGGKTVKADPVNLCPLHRRYRTEETERRPGGGHSLEKVGPLSERAAVGHGPRGLQPGRKRLETISTMTSPGHAPTAGARTVWAGSPTINSACALPWRSGTGATRS